MKEKMSQIQCNKTIVKETNTKKNDNIAQLGQKESNISRISVMQYPKYEEKISEKE